MTDNTRITETTTKPFDLIVGLTQKYLNDTLVTFWEKNTTTQTLKAHNIGGKIDGVMGPPTVEFNVDDPETSVVFTLHFQGGTTTLNDVETGDPAGTYPLANCYMGFKVDIARNTIPQHLPDGTLSPEYKDFAEKNNVDPGDYSLNRIILDLTTADLVTLIAAKSKFPDTGSATVDFTGFIKYWIEGFLKVGGNIVGLHAAVSTGAQVEGSFPPTTLDLQTYPFRGEGNKGTDNNCIVYAQMVGSNPRPSPPVFSYSGNIVNAGGHGTMIISNETFFEGWLLPVVLQEINYLTWINQAYVHNSGVEGSENWTWDCKMGTEAAPPKTVHTDPIYKFKVTAPDGKNNLSRSWTWDGGVSSDEAHHGVWGSYVNNDLTVHTLNTVKFTPGDNTILVSGNIHVWASNSTTAAGSGNSTLDWNWSFGITVKGTEKGNLVLELADVQFPTNPQIERHTNGIETSPSSIIDKVNGKVPIALKQVLDYEATIRDVLAHQGSFVLPGSGSFSQTSPVLNSNGDLLVDLTYLPS